jgi:cytochrome c-type biogenesis protein CcmH/NrfG
MIWLTAWGMLTPALARWTLQRDQSTTENVIRTLRIEPWLSMAPAARLRTILADPAPWPWERAAEALQWARTAVDVHPGLARRWADLGRVHLRILTDLGGTDENIVSARRCLDRACELDPHLPWYWLEQARLARISGNSELAVKHTRHALEQEPNTIRGWLFLSRLELELGRMSLAQDALIEAERLAQLDRANLNDYELELMLVPQSQLDSLRSAMTTQEGP